MANCTVAQPIDDLPIDLLVRVLKSLRSAKKVFCQSLPATVLTSIPTAEEIAFAVASENAAEPSVGQRST